MNVLTEEEIAAQLGGVPAWQRQGDSIVMTVTRADFKDALLFVGAVAFRPRRPATIRTSPSPGTR